LWPQAAFLRDAEPAAARHGQAPDHADIKTQHRAFCKPSARSYHQLALGRMGGLDRGLIPASLGQARKGWPPTIRLVSGRGRSRARSAPHPVSAGLWQARCGLAAVGSLERNESRHDGAVRQHAGKIRRVHAKRDRAPERAGQALAPPKDRAAAIIARRAGRRPLDL
jgi:hypothetical protein